MKLGVYQCDAAWHSQEARLAALEAHLEGCGCDLVLCPELFSSGYNPERDYAQVAEDPDGPFAQAMAGLARRHEVALCWGYPERAGDTVFNSAALVDAKGRPVANHRKRLASPGSFEEQSFTNGDTLTFAEIAGIRLAIIICYEVEFPESLRQAALGGAQLVLVPTALGAGWGVVAETIVPARAFENGIYLAYADQAGQEGSAKFFGGSRLAGPDGRAVCAPVGQEAFFTADMDPAHARAAQARLPYLRDCQKL